MWTGGWRGGPWGETRHLNISEGTLIVFLTTSTKAYFPVLYLLTATDLQVASIPVALIYLMAIAIRYSYEFVPDRAYIGLSPDYMIVFLCLLQLAAPQIGSTLAYPVYTHTH